MSRFVNFRKLQIYNGALKSNFKILKKSKVL